MPLFIESLKDEGQNFETLGWEDVDGHRCLKVRLGPPGIHEQFYWLDIERGGHPLKCETFLRSKLRSQNFGIELARIQGDDAKPSWIPVRGRHFSYVETVEILSKTPVFEETYQVIDKTIRINKGLPDNRFSLDWLPKSGSGELAKTIVEFKNPPEAFRRPRSAQQALDRVIAAADRQSEQLEASAPSRESWARRNPATVTLISVGLIITCVAAYLKRRTT